MTDILEVLWTLLLVVEIGGGGDGAGYIVTERFGPYESRGSCSEAAQSFAAPVVEAGHHGTGLRAYCVPAN